MSTEDLPTGSKRLRLGEAYKFFIPLMLMAELMMFSHAVIVAFLARMENPEEVLAAYSVAFYFHATVGSPVWACQIVYLSFIKDRLSVRKLLVFGYQTVLAVLWIWLLVSYTSVGDWLFGEFFGLSDHVRDAAKYALLVSIWVPIITVWRFLAYALLMVEKKTVWVTVGTVIRLAGLGLILAIATQGYEGAWVGLAALVGCIAIETVFAVVIALPYYLKLPEKTSAPPTYRELWRFSWPIMLMQTAESGIAFIMNFFLGRLPRPELAIAAFGVLDGLIRVLLSPLRNLIHTTQALVKNRADARVVIIFSLHAAIFFGTIMLCFNIPIVRDFVLYNLMGLTTEMADAVTPALQLSAILALCMAAGGVTRGLLIASKNTGAIAATSAVRVGAVFAVGLIGAAIGATDGAMLGLLGLTFAFGAEAVVLAWRLVAIDRAGSKLFGERS